MLRYAAGTLLVLLFVAALTGYLLLRASLPQLSGKAVTPPRVLSATASIERDAAGTPTIRAQTRTDLAFATGYAHAQDRFFQMDLMRRAAAGELSELLGASMIETDKRLRLHDLQHVAAEVINTAKPADRAIVNSYVSGVNAGLASLSARPWEYFLLRSEPRAWVPEDSVLVGLSLYVSLNDWSGDTERARGAMQAALPAELFAFLNPLGTEWDAPLTGGRWQAPPLPSADVIDLRKRSVAATSQGSTADPDVVGSNSWAVDGAHAVNGRALLANDMHLGLRLPHTWYRARLVTTAGAELPLDLVGVTLPGMPMLIVGSNGHVAWGFTNSYGDWSDVIVAAADPVAKDKYLLADGSEPYRVRQEVIRVRGGESVRYDVQMTRWGPVIDRDAQRSLVLAWTAHHARASNLELRDLERVTTIDEALNAANRSGIPVQNFVAVDSTGHIGWTLMGQVPVRANYDSSLPTSWQNSDTGWVGWRTPGEYPRVVDPASGRLWTANARTIDAESWLGFLGDGGYDLGARAAQIRDDLLSLDAATVDDMRKVQLDDRALFLTRWRDLLAALLTPNAVKGQAHREQALRLIGKWSGHAAIDDAGYRIVRAFRLRVRDAAFAALVSGMPATSPKLTPSPQFEAPLWQLVTEQPPHLLSSQFANWNDALLHALDESLATLVEECGELATCTWGKQNTLSMRHPLSAAVPLIGRWLDMPAQALPGDSSMPRVQGPAFGASQRLVVSPGHEDEGILQVPGGPVDHPLSPFYGAGHAAWARGDPTPLLPGKTAHTLELVRQQ